MKTHSSFQQKSKYAKKFKLLFSNTQYTSSQQKQNNKNFNTISRFNYQQVNTTPGPGAYEFQEYLSPKGIIMSKAARKTQYILSTPGVGSYHQKSQASLSFTFRTSSSSRLKTLPTPGPATYNPKTSQSTSVKISESKRLWKYVQTEATPGPGAYDLIQQQAYHRPPKFMNLKIKKHSSTGNLSEIDSLKSFNSVSQQGKIMPRFQQSLRKFEFLDPLNVRSPTPITRSPGPAQYSVNQSQKGRNSLFPKQKRPEVFTIPKTPGVGQYSKIPAFGKVYVKKKRINQDSIKNQKILSQLLLLSVDKF